MDICISKIEFNYPDTSKWIISFHEQNDIWHNEQTLHHTNTEIHRYTQTCYPTNTYKHTFTHIPHKHAAFIRIHTHTSYVVIPTYCIYVSIYTKDLASDTERGNASGVSTGGDKVNRYHETRKHLVTKFEPSKQHRKNLKLWNILP